MQFAPRDGSSQDMYVSKNIAQPKAVIVLILLLKRIKRGILHPHLSIVITFPLGPVYLHIYMALKCVFIWSLNFFFN